MSTDVLEFDESIQRRFGTVADDARVTRTAAALEANGIRVLRAGTRPKRNRSCSISSRMVRRCTVARPNRLT